VKKRTLEGEICLLEYWGEKFKDMEQPKESVGNNVLYTKGSKNGDGKTELVEIQGQLYILQQNLGAQVS